MGIFGKFKKDESVQVMDTSYQSYSTPFTPIPKGNLSLPYVNPRYTSNGYVPFGADNLYPQYLNQMFYTSPLHSSICTYKVNSVCGGGYDLLNEGLTPMERVDLYAFEKKAKLRKNTKTVALDLIVHGRVYFCVNVKNGKAIRFDKIGAEKVRVNNLKTVYYVNTDWQYSSEVKTLTPYRKGCADGEYIYIYETNSLGQDIYSLQPYTSAMNWIFLDGEMSYLHKSNIQNSVFPSFALMFPKKFQSPEEMQTVKDTVEKMKGAENAGKAVVFSANTKEQLPELIPIPTNSNDQLFIQTDGRIDEKICQAHQIDPLLMGIRVSGKLGSGLELPTLTQTFEKNVVIPLREELEEIFNDLIELAGVKGEYVCKEYQVIDEQIVDKTQTKRTEE
jgi:hypothetical protein